MSVTSTKPKLNEGTAEDSRAKAIAPARPGLPMLPLALLAAAGGLFVLAYWNTMTWWVDEWTREGSFYAHGIFIPFFVAIMVWRDRERLRRLPMGNAWSGLALVALAIAILLISKRAEVAVPESISFVIFLIGATLVLAGKRITGALLIPMLFLFTMIPLVPDQLINIIAFPIQVISAKLAAGLCSLIGFSSTVTGTTVAMPSFKLNVELPCSGFKTLLGLLSFSAAFAYVVEGEKWKRWALFLVSGPLAILINGLRIALIGLAGELFGEHAAHVFHDYSGFIVLILGFTFLFNFARLLRCDNFLGLPLTDGPKDGSAATANGERAEKPDQPTQAERDAAAQAAYDVRWGAPRRVAWASLARGLIPILTLLVLSVAAERAISAPSRLIAAVGAQDVPTILAADGTEWRAKTFTESNGQTSCDIPLSPTVKSALNPISYVSRRYEGGKTGSGSLDLFITAGNGRKVFHDPHTCFLGSGYYMHDVRVETIDTPSGPLKLQVTEAENTLDHSRTLIMFCYLIDGKQLQTTQQLNTNLMWQLIFGDSGRPSYFLRFSQMNPGTDPARQEELRSFAKAVWTSIAAKATGPANTNGRIHRRGAENAEKGGKGE